ncbi:MAG: aminopeptidase N, partial [Anderseniella sp.]
MRTDLPQTIRLKDYKPFGYLIDHVSLDISLDPTSTHVKSTLRMKRNPASKIAGAALKLNGEEIELLSVSINGTRLDNKQYSVDKEGLTVPVVPQDTFEISIETTCNPDQNTALSGLYRSNGIFCTQCEAEGFRR